jgi:chromate transporter
MPPDSANDAVVSFSQSFRVWARIGLLGFGGPAGQIALMHRELVEQRRWISEPRFLHALNYCMLLPGPEAHQLAIYLGWLLHRTWGGIVAGVLFVLPGALVLAVLSWVYVRFGEVPAVAAVFFGLKAAILAIVVDAVLRIARRALGSRILVAIAVLAFVAIALLRVPFPWIVLGAAVIGYAVHRLRPAWLPAAPAPAADGDARYAVDRLLSTGDASHTRPQWRRAVLTACAGALAWLAPLALAFHVLGSDHVIVREGVFFSQAAVVTFGGAYAVLAYVGQRAVEDFAWLQPGEMVDGLALAETTPGPLILVLQFVGFLAAYRFPGGLNPMLAAVLGAAMTAWVTFVPSFLFIFAGAPYVESLRGNAALHAALRAVTAAIVGVILNLALWFALHTLFGRLTPLHAGPIIVELPVPATLDVPAAGLAALAMLAILRFKAGLAATLLGCAALGAAIRLLPLQ